jgi:hypothetical protein
MQKLSFFSARGHKSATGVYLVIKVDALHHSRAPESVPVTLIPQSCLALYYFSFLFESLRLWLMPIVRMPLIRVYLRCRSSAGGGEEVKYKPHFISLIFQYFILSLL